MIYVIKDEKQKLICSNSYQQAIFDFKGILCLSERLNINEIKKLKSKSSFSKLEKTALKHNISLTLCDKNNLEKINNTSETEIIETDKPLELLAKNSTEHTQYGFISKKGIKSLFGKHLRLQHTPEYLKGILGFNKLRLDISQKFHDSLTEILADYDYKNARKMIESYVKLDFDSFISKIYYLLKPLNNSKHKTKNNNYEKNEYKGRILINAGSDNINILENIANTVKTKLSLPAHSFRHIPFVDVRCPKKEIITVEKELQKNYAAKIAKEIKLLPIEKSSIQIYKPTYTNLVQIGAYEAQNTTKGKGVNVGVIDTGIDYNHEQLKSRFGRILGYDFVNETENPFDDNGHGTHVSGIISGAELGVAPLCNLFALKALDSRGMGSEADLISAIDWAIENDIHILNMSLGSSMPSMAESAAIYAAHKNGIILVAAAGNDGNGSYNYPASYNSVQSIAAVDHRNNHAYFSNHNDRVFISAPGVEIFSCYPNNTYIELSGTSMATPHVTGVNALMISLQNNAHLEEILEATANPLGKGKDAQQYYGAGIIRADKAVASILQPEVRT